MSLPDSAVAAPRGYTHCMPSVLSSGVRVNYQVLGAGEPLLLIHGYSASARTNWEAPGWFGTQGTRKTLPAWTPGP